MAFNNINPIAIDLFCGAGGLSLGLEQSNITVPLGVEINAIAAQTYTNNLNGNVLQDDIRNITGHEILEQLNLQVGELFLLAGCPPCQTFSSLQKDDVTKLMETYDWADKIVSVSPSYWADIPGQFKVFIDRCTPWCNTHEPHAKLSSGKKGYTIALRTGPSMPECERIISNIEHFYGHLEIEPCGKLGLCGVEYKEDLENRLEEIKDFCNLIKEQ